MGRPRSFDSDTALAQALELFWTRGYDATSIADLVETTGVSRSGLYQVWGDKRGLFLAALDRYGDTATALTLAPLWAEDAGRTTIEAHFRAMLDMIAGPDGDRSCLILNTVVELGLHDAEIHARTRGYLDQVRNAFAHALTRAVARGEIHASLAVEPHADHLAIAVQGLLLQSHARPGPAALQAYVDLTLSTLGGAT